MGSQAVAFAVLGKVCKKQEEHDSRAVVGMQRFMSVLQGSAMQRSGNKMDKEQQDFTAQGCNGVLTGEHSFQDQVSISALP